MSRNALDIVLDMAEYLLNYLFDMRLIEAPRNIFYLGITIFLGQIASRTIIGFPMVIWEEITKKKVPFDLGEKIMNRGAVVMTIVIILIIVYSEIK